MTLAVTFEEARNAPHGLGQVIGIGQEDDAEMVGRDPVEARALHDQDLRFSQ
ncbi:hypothetical protein D3C72_1862970 [compost metagenome]